ncbi:DUF3592 domain-containing protein [Pleionea sediminis]|uniref:DUF3592 domain-containing protein n=1 Tax=Pleionea sediminis TaxID=2569479 RepID=UPI0011857796|nr:DUF3592 domain-containing protein [Pleionea sediminis]
MKRKSSPVLIGVFFILIGGSFLYLLALSKMIEAYQMQSWRPVPADLISAELTSYLHTDEDGHSTTMYKVKMRYRYVIDGNPYIGSRVNVDNFSSSDRDEHADRLSNIERLAARENLRVWVNPDDPIESVFDRTISWSRIIAISLFSCVFISVGVFIIRFSKKAESEEDEEGARLFSEIVSSASTENKLDSKEIYSTAKGNIRLWKYASIISFFFFLTFSVGLIGSNLVGTIVAILFFIPPFIISYVYWKKRVEWNYFKDVPLVLSPYPGVIGGEVKGHLIIPKEFHPSDKYNISLNCTQTETQKSHNKTSIRSHLIYENSISPVAKEHEQGSFLEFEFYVPADKPSTARGDNAITWSIEVKSKLKTINLKRSYDIPVFRTAKSQSVKDELKSKPLSKSEKRRIEQKVSFQRSSNDNQMSKSETKSTNRKADIKDIPEELTFHTPKLAAGLLLTLMGLAFFLIGVTLFAVKGEIFGLFFALVSSVFLGFGIYIWGKNCKVKVTPNCIEVDQYLFSKLIKKHRYRAQEISSIKPIVIHSSSQAGKAVRNTYGLSLYIRNGESVDLGGNFKSKKNAIYMIEQIEQVLHRE